MALKGGTAINLTIFNLPRLSIDIDLDYLGADSRDDMLKNREVINQIISKFMLVSGYTLNPKTKNPHSLDSWVYEYINAVGNRDNIKIEINYSMRMHILPAFFDKCKEQMGKSKRYLYNELKMKKNVYEEEWQMVTRADASGLLD